MQLSPNFSLAELTISGTGARAGLMNNPSEMQIEHLKALAQVLELARVALDEHPIIIHSGFRSPAINKLVGGVANSAHLTGYAADLICPSYGPPLAVARQLSVKLPHFDQLIYEYETWVHVSADPAMRREVLRISADGRGYQLGLERDPLVA